MVSQSILPHIVLECDGLSYTLCVFSDSVDRLKGGSKLIYSRSRDVNFDPPKYFFIYPESSRSRTVHFEYMDPAWIKVVQVVPYHIGLI